METLYYTLVADGTSDDTIIPILEWLFEQYDILAEVQRDHPPKIGSLTEHIQDVLDAAEDSIDLLFVHRDAEKEKREKRLQEIDEAVAVIESCPQHIPVIPIRMTEAWLLFNEDALRRAVGNSSGKPRLTLPSMKTVESLPDPKKELFKQLQAAHNPTNKRQRVKAKKKKFADRHEVARQIDDFSPLRQLSAFQALEADFCEVLGVEQQGG